MIRPEPLFVIMLLTILSLVLIMYLFGPENNNFFKQLFWKDLSAKEAFDAANVKKIKKQNEVYRNTINYIRNNAEQGKTTCDLMKDYDVLYNLFIHDETLAKYIAKRLKLEGYTVHLDFYSHIGGVSSFTVSWNKGSNDKP